VTETPSFEMPSFEMEEDHPMDADQLVLTTRIDEALDQFRGRDLVAASEVVDLLLDLRLMLLAADSPAAATS
jgi:hypothetical protein